MRLQTFAQLQSKSPADPILVDTHNDFLSKAVEDHLAFDTDLRGVTQSDLSRMQSGGVKVQIFSIFCDGHFGRGSAFREANKELDSLYAITARNPATMQIVYSYGELLEAVKNQKLACLSGVEGGHMIEDNMEYLDSFYKRGVRYMTLTWNNSTSWATSAKDETDSAFKVTPYGLNAYGRQVILRMNQLGMMVDISHVGEKTFWDVIACTTKPVIASHSSVYALCPVPRNLKDNQIRAIAANGGVIQVNFYSGFIDSAFFPKIARFRKDHQAESDSLIATKQAEYKIFNYFSKKYPAEFANMRPPLSLLIDHVDYIAKLVGVDYVGLGSDFDGIESSPEGMDGVEDYPKIKNELLKRGYSQTDIEKILGGNFLRVFKANDIFKGML